MTNKILHLIPDIFREDIRNQMAILKIQEK